MWHNFGGVPIAEMMQSYIPPRRRIKNRAEILRGFVGLSPEYDALDYLNLAASAVHSDGSGGECGDYAISVYDFFRELVRRNKRKDLRRSVRLVTSLFTEDETGKTSLVGHDFIEVNTGNRYMPFEPTMETPLLDPFNTASVKRYTDESLACRTAINGEADRYASFRTVTGTKICYPIGQFFRQMPLGASQLLIGCIFSMPAIREQDRSWKEYHQSSIHR